VFFFSKPTQAFSREKPGWKNPVIERFSRDLGGVKDFFALINRRKNLALALFDHSLDTL
jgi:hypothetical protein